jgi:hypothetical protein
MDLGYGVAKLSLAKSLMGYPYPVCASKATSLGQILVKRRSNLVKKGV